MTAANIELRSELTLVAERDSRELVAREGDVRPPSNPNPSRKG